MSELKIEWEIFKNQMNSFGNKGEELSKISTRSIEETNNFVTEYKEWRDKVVNFLISSLDSTNSYVQSFRIANSNKYNLHGNQTSFDNFAREQKQDLKNDLLYIQYITKLLSVSDLIIKPNQIDLSIREKYTSEDILELILDKLYELYDNNIYPILPILEGNGIILKKQREEFEYVKLLENFGYIISNNIARQADAQLTVNGKIYVENKLKQSKPNYESICDDKEIINSKIDDLMGKLEKLGFGQEIIYNELEELKELYIHLNKKNWGELVKGKIIDLGLQQIINEDIMKIIYNSITNDVLRIP
ncbi:hypothetical protein [Flavobacterium sp. UBA7663]|uniref:hypothetical protein n=1 Tax=Flavobacterium sp. UBA7663 TaxID=1946557 RepID=UPI0025C502D7|nr:hypothetical protein [Flavobacterium sp. UBA7663]